MNIVPLSSPDLADVVEIQALVYESALVESKDVLAAKLHLAPDFCFLARVEDRAAGYLLAHPWLDDQAPGLQSKITSIPDNASVVHLHDMAVHPDFGGRGIGRALLKTLIATAEAQGFDRLTLVAVQEAQAFWEKMRFTAVGPVAGYDDHAVFMRRPCLI